MKQKPLARIRKNSDSSRAVQMRSFNAPTKAHRAPIKTADMVTSDFSVKPKLRFIAK
jgi:hypothetical protein